jgi:hypothetical protein
VKFAFISEEKVAFPIAVMCRLLVVSPSGDYASQGRPPRHTTVETGNWPNGWRWCTWGAGAGTAARWFTLNSRPRGSG